MRYRPVLLPILALFLGGSLAAAPAWRGPVTLIQPDGTAFTALLRGDERSHILTTTDGCAILRDPDGTYRYARYDDQGRKHSTGIRVGEAASPAESRIIPYNMIRGLARESGLPAVRSLPQPRTKAGGPHRVPVILAQFPDLAFRYGRTDFAALLNDGPESAAAYFGAIFGTAFTFDVTDVVTLPHKYAYYGENGSDDHDKNPQQLVYDACTAASGSVGFSRYDNDGDGEVEAVFVFFAGGDEAEGAGDDHPWSHQWNLHSKGLALTLDGVKVDTYACAAELRRTDDRYGLATIGTFCHEYSHTFGLPDLYDVDYEASGGTAEALWRFTSLMDGGNHDNYGRTPPTYNAVERHLLGLGTALPLTIGRHTLSPLQDSGTYGILEDGDGEAFLFECRASTGWDAYIGGSGLLIYHLDRSTRPAGMSDTRREALTAVQRWQYGEVNCRPDYQCADLVEADADAVDAYRTAIGTHDYHTVYRLVRRVFFPQGGTRFTPYTTPAFTFRSGTGSPLSLIGIGRDGEDVTFTVVESGTAVLPTALMDKDGIDAFQDAAILSWSASEPDYEGPAILRWGIDGEWEEREVLPYRPGLYACILEGLVPLTSYDVEIFFRVGDLEGRKDTAGGFFTRKRPARSYPYIWFNRKVGRNDDGSFPTGSRIPLRAYSPRDIAAVEWTLDGREIAVEADGYYTLTAGGLLRAVITYEDGAHDIVTKTITLR